VIATNPGTIAKVQGLRVFSPKTQGVTMVEDNLIADLAQTFANLSRYHWKLHPKKWFFSVPSGKLLGFMVSHCDIEANPTKVDAIHKMKRTTGKKDVT
jgi:hypothetical protein